jgi:Ca2+-binding RTX toxin-like protein
VLTANAGANRLDGGTGVDTASYSASDTGVIVGLGFGNASGGYAAGDTLISIENLTGSNFGDILDGSSGRNTIFGGGGNDSLSGGEKVDVLSGGDGDDRLVGGQGADKLTGGLGNDTYWYTSLNDAGDEITGWRADLGNDDHFEFETVAFGGLPEGVLATQRFQRGAGHEAETRGVRFIYDNMANELWFDANGSAAGGQTLIASFDRDVGLSAADIFITDSRTERFAEGLDWY